ncbi:MAG: efflux RND transporter permease subunit [Synergistales bacterium]|nr:efflux RND transporter permease subunit [Synergistales bacterium]MDY6400911.1 efflux RND transporter permease subunit [Synergistales bacterium]MDY6405383.1 efflux RND transporter permease subunit [Synergistales bacterium]MDY6410068.1 efflux RND transporter permease subunit [Synergistales bacterium]MDY6413718.1 efflux RND transporter permease subunit [Synergistales bacterium]
MDIARASIKRTIVVLFICLLITLGGVSAYFSIGKLEDPAFTIKTAVVSIMYPGSTVYESEQEAASRMEDAIQAMGEVKKIRTRCSPGSATIYVDIKDEYTAADLPQVWNSLRQKVNDALVNLPAGCTVVINNDFGDVFGQYYALTGDGYTMKELYDYADFLKKELVLVPEVAKVNIIGEQTEAVYVEFSSSRLRSLGISSSTIFDILNQQNTLSAMGKTFYGEQYVTINPTGGLLNVEDFGETVIGGGEKHLIRLKEVAEIRRDYVNPQTMMMYFNGQPALGIGISTVTGGNVVTMGQAVEERLEELEEDCPIGMELNKIYMQSDGVVKSVNDFVINLIESLVIVVGVLLVFMGMRSGLMIGIVLLLTVAATLIVMNQQGIFLQQVSLAAMIIALGSLVDNAIVVTEGMLIGIQRGQSSEDAASETVSGSIWAMLGGTFIAVLAFAPIGLSPDNTGEFCRSLLQVVGISMMLSWLFAITATPVIGNIMLKPSGQSGGDPYNSFLFRAYRAFLEGCLRRRFLTIAVVVIMFAFSLVTLVVSIEKVFFPSSTAMYFVADLWQREGTSINVQRDMTEKLAERLQKRPDVKNVTSTIGGGNLRFMLTYSPPDSDNSFSELLVEVKEGGDPQEILRETQRIIDEEMPGVIGVCKLFSKGASMAPVIEARFYGDDPLVLRGLAQQALEIMEEDPIHNCVRLDWNDRVAVFRPQIRKDRMQSLGLTRPKINNAILMGTTGVPVGEFRDKNKSLPILFGLIPEERNRIESLHSLPIWSSSANRSVTLGSIISGVELSYEDEVIMRRNRKRVLTVASDVINGSNVSEMQERIRQKIEAIPIPLGYRFEWGGEDESQKDAMNGMSKLFLPCLVLMFTIMVFLFNGFRQPFIIFGSIPLIVIGVVIGLLLAHKPLDFLSIVGILSLVGMLAKNSIVLLDQVASDFASGKDRYLAIVETGISRLRPVAMSAVTTVLGMIPLIWDSMFGPMAVTIMGGLTVSTILTMVFIPVMTAVAYNVPNPDSDSREDEDEDEDK